MALPTVPAPVPEVNESESCSTRANFSKSTLAAGVASTVSECVIVNKPSPRRRVAEMTLGSLESFASTTNSAFVSEFGRSPTSLTALARASNSTAPPFPPGVSLFSTANTRCASVKMMVNSNPSAGRIVAPVRAV